MDNTLRALVDVRDRVLQKNRIAFGLRLGAIERGMDQNSNGSVHLLQEWEARFQTMEKYADEDIKRLVKDKPIVQEMIRVKGIGLMLAAKVVAMIDIERADSVSALWRYAGYAVIEGARERPVKGERLHYNSRLKSTCYLVGSAFLKANSPYRRVYDSAKEYYQANRPEWTKAHIHNASMRKMIKMWLEHLWITWRVMEGLDTRGPYVINKLGHTHYYAPEEFGWGVATEGEAGT